MLSMMIAAWLAALSPCGLGDEKPLPPPEGTAEVKKELCEEELVAEIRRLVGPRGPAASPEDEIIQIAGHSDEAVQRIDELLKRFPATPDREQMLINKLILLADLARVHESYLGALLQTTEDISESRPTGRLAEANDFYAIRAFVMAARFEKMDEQRRMLGAAERYRAFLEDHPTSAESPIIFASLVRTWLGLGKMEEAEKTLGAMKAVFASHPSTRRAAGEVKRARAVGQPYSINAKFSDGSSLDTSQHSGHVLVLHFWMTGHKASMSFLRELSAIADAHGDAKLHLEGVSLDGPAGLKEAQAAPFQNKARWPQHFETKGLRSEVVIDNGVVELPTCFVFDAKGVLRAVLSGEKTRETAALVEKLLAEAEAKTESTPAP